MNAIGTITEMLEVKSGTSKAGKEWKTQSFVINTGDEYNPHLCFEMFGEDKVTNLTKFNKVGDEVEVEFNLSSRSWTNPKTNKTSWFTKADAWKITKTESQPQQNEPEVQPANEFMTEDFADDLPF